MTTTRRRRFLPLALLLSLVALLTGCGRIYTDVTLHSNDTMDIVMVVAISDQVAEQMGMTPEEMISSSSDDDPPLEGGTEEPYSQDGYTGKQWTIEGQPISDKTDGQQFTVVREGDEFVVTGTLDNSTIDMDEVTGMGGSFDIRLSVTFPGEVTDHNGTLEGNTVTWTPADDGDTIFDLYARGNAGGGGLGIWLWVIIGVAVLAVIGVIVGVLVSKSKKRQQAQQWGAVPQYGEPGQYGGQPAQQWDASQQPQQWDASQQPQQWVASQQPQQWDASQQPQQWQAGAPGQYGAQPPVGQPPQDQPPAGPERFGPPSGQ